MIAAGSPTEPESGCGRLAWIWRSLAWVHMDFVRPLPWQITRNTALAEQTIELPCWPLPTSWGITGPLSRIRVMFLLTYVQECLTRAQNEFDVSISAHVYSVIAKWISIALLDIRNGIKQEILRDGRQDTLMTTTEPSINCSSGAKSGLK